MKVKHEVKTVELASLVPYEKNPNVHTQAQIEALAKSMETYGQYYPIIVDENMHILCGHGKKLALEHLGKKQGEVKILHGLTDKQKLKIVLEDNKIQTLGYMDYTMMNEIIKEIGDVDIIGFDTTFLETIINENVRDNMGVDFSAPVEKKSNEQQVANIPQEHKEAQDGERNDFESGMQQARTMRCPHCGKEITL